MTDKQLDLLLNDTGALALDDEARRHLDGSFINLRSGNTHYELAGEGEVVVLVHGYATPYFIYDEIFYRLADAGYKVLRYDLYGRGFSERVAADYSPEFFALQLKELTDALLPDETFTLVGTSMGGSITATFCAMYPGRASRLILLAPAGMSSFKPPAYMRVCAAPGAGEALFQRIGAKTLTKGCSAELIYSPDKRDEMMAKFARALRFEGMLRCTYLSLKNTILQTEKVTEYYKITAAKNIPMLVIWGTADKTMPYYQSELMRRICPLAKYITYNGSGHIFVYDEGERTAGDILEFLSK